MDLHLTEKQYRRLLDLVYIGNWVLNSTRGDDRITDYDKVESLIFSHCLDHGMAPLVELYNGEIIPSRAFAEGGIHEAIMAYEDITFFEILAEELALRDLDAERATAENYDEVMDRMEQYMGEFEAHPAPPPQAGSFFAPAGPRRGRSALPSRHSGDIIAPTYSPAPPGEKEE